MTLQDGLNTAVWVYFVVLIIFGAFFAVNLALAVLYLQFTHSQLEVEVEKEDAARAAEAAEAARRAATAHAGFTNRVVRSQASVAPSKASSLRARMQTSILLRFLGWMQRICKNIEAEPKFEALTLCLISLNTVLMASEYHGMQPWHVKVRNLRLHPSQTLYCLAHKVSIRIGVLRSQFCGVTCVLVRCPTRVGSVLHKSVCLCVCGELLYLIVAHIEIVQMNEVVNVILTTYFTLEMLIKVIGLGVKEYLSDAMNAFDAAVVISSVAELIVFLRGGGRGTLSVFRAFRLMRVFKLARRWEELNKIVQTIFKSISSIAYLSLLLLVFVFIMALLGMQIFGYK